MASHCEFSLHYAECRAQGQLEFDDVIIFVLLSSLGANFAYLATLLVDVCAEVGSYALWCDEFINCWLGCCRELFPVPWSR